MPRTIALIAFGFLLLVGCSSSPKDDSMGDEERVRYGLGYYEVEHEGVTYVVGSDASVMDVKAGKVPKETVGRFSAGGKRVLIDASDPSTRARLVHEYDRRHGGR